jgi:hypothetical protein
MAGSVDIGVEDHASSRRGRVKRHVLGEEGGLGRLGVQEQASAADLASQLVDPGDHVLEQTAAEAAAPKPNGEGYRVRESVPAPPSGDTPG